MKQLFGEYYMGLLILIAIIFLAVKCCRSQDTIVTAAGDEYSYYLNSDKFSQFLTGNTKLAVNMFVNNQGDKSVWVQNISLKETEFLKLMNYIDTIPHIAVGAKGYQEKVLDSFEVFANDNNNLDFMPMNKYNNKNIDIILIQQKIKIFFKL